MVRSARIDRATVCLEGRCSIQLSYERHRLQAAKMALSRAIVIPLFAPIGCSIVARYLPKLLRSDLQLKLRCVANDRDRRRDSNLRTIQQPMQVIDVRNRFAGKSD